MIFKLLKYLFIFCLSFYGQQLYSQYNFTQYSIQEGLPQSQVFDGFQDSKGYLWFGTQGGGVSRFDGIEFENYTIKNGLPSNYIRTIKEDKIGRIWVGCSEGLAFFDNKAFQTISHEKTLNVNTILSLPDTSIWLGTQSGIFQCKNKRLKKLSLKGGLDAIGVNDMLLVGQDKWIATNNGVWKVNNEIKRYGSKKGIRGKLSVSLLVDSKGLLWVANFDGGLSIYDKSDDRFQPFKGITNLKNPICLYENNDNHLWIGSRDRGIYDYNTIDSTWNIINEKQGLPHNHIRSIFNDHWDNTWICTSGGGVAKYLGRFFAHYDMSDGLIGKYIYALDNDLDGNLLFTASNSGLMKYDGFSFMKIPIDKDHLQVKSKALLTDHLGNIWIGTEGKGLIKIDRNQHSHIYTTDDGLPDNWIRNIVEDQSGDIWLSTNNKGIVRLKAIPSEKDSLTPDGVDSLKSKYEFKVFTKEERLPDLYISCLTIAPDGKVWFGTKLGNLGYIKDDYIVETYGNEQGLPKVSIRSIAFDINHRVWVGTAGKGVYKSNGDLESQSFNPIELNDELYSNNIYSLLFDPENNLWVGSEAGVDKVTINASQVITGTEHYGKNEGFHGIETCQNAALVGSNGVLWFGTMNGLMNHSPGQQFNAIDTPSIHFTDISIFYKSIEETEYKSYINTDGSLNGDLILPYYENHLSFEFKALNINDAKGLKHQWKLTGIETSWSPLSKRSSVNYSNLVAGKYCFEVRAISRNGIMSPIVESCFTIKEAFWQWTWVQLLFGLIILSVLGLLVSRWKSNLMTKENKKREALEVQNHVLQLEQKALQLQMNPHFIFNALNSIQSLVATEEYRSARNQIGNFAVLMRGILSNSRENKISLAQEVDVLERYLTMEQFCQNTPFDYEIKFDKNIEIEEMEIPPMILQPYVENAIIHGISHLKTRGQLTILFQNQELRSGQKLLNCTIIDNGVGRKKANELKQSSNQGHQSVAMEVTKERLDTLRGEESYETLFIEDVLSNEGVVIGTKVLVKIPVEITY